MEGVVFRVNSATQFVLLVQKTENLLNVPSGSFVTVAANPSTVQFGIDAGDLPVDASLFAACAGTVQTLEAPTLTSTLRQVLGSQREDVYCRAFPQSSRVFSRSTTNSSRSVERVPSTT
jgi:hypothetical protein